MPSAYIFDLDGTLYDARGAIPGAVETIDALRRVAPVRFLTNTTRMNRASVLANMREYGFHMEDHELFTPAVGAASLLRERGVERVAAYVAPEVLDDLGELEVVAADGAQPEAVIVGDFGDRWTVPLLNQAFRFLMDGALFVALQKGRYWMGATGLELDAGAFVTALEYATSREALVTGKPEEPLYHAVLASAGLRPPFSRENPPVMIGDDLWNDVRGAQEAGFEGWLVRTGKFREDVLAESGVEPDRVIEDVTRVV